MRKILVISTLLIFVTSLVSVLSDSLSARQNLASKMNPVQFDPIHAKKSKALEGIQTLSLTQPVSFSEDMDNKKSLKLKLMVKRHLVHRITGEKKYYKK